MDFLIILAVTADVMFAAIACGTSGIIIRPASCAVMACVSSGFLILSAFGSGILFNSLPEDIIRLIGAASLACIGSWQIISGCFSEKLCCITRQTPSFFRKIFEINRDASAADCDRNLTLSPAEAFVLAVPVSIDSLIGGLGISAIGIELIYCFLSGFVCCYLSVFLGNHVASKIPLKNEYLRSFLCGGILICLGICKILF